MNLKLLKPKNCIPFIILTLVISVANTLFAQENEDPITHNEDETDLVPDYSQMACQWTCPPVTKVTPTFHGFTVQSAVELYELLACLYQDWQVYGLSNSHLCYSTTNPPPPCSNQTPTCTPNSIIINITPGYHIYLSDLPASVFPLEVPPGVTIQGNYNIGVSSNT